MTIPEQIQGARYENYIHRLLEPGDDAFARGNYKRIEELSRWLLKCPEMTREERDRIEFEREQFEDEYLREHGII